MKKLLLFLLSSIFIYSCSEENIYNIKYIDRPHSECNNNLISISPKTISLYENECKSIKIKSNSSNIVFTYIPENIVSINNNNEICAGKINELTALVEVTAQIKGTNTSDIIKVTVNKKENPEIKPEIPEKPEINPDSNKTPTLKLESSSNQVIEGKCLKVNVTKTPAEATVEYIITQQNNLATVQYNIVENADSTIDFCVNNTSHTYLDIVLIGKNTNTEVKSELPINVQKDFSGESAKANIFNVNSYTLHGDFNSIKSGVLSNSSDVENCTASTNQDEILMMMLLYDINSISNHKPMSCFKNFPGNEKFHSSAICEKHLVFSDEIKIKEKDKIKLGFAIAMKDAYEENPAGNKRYIIQQLDNDKVFAFYLTKDEKFFHLDRPLNIASTPLGQCSTNYKLKLQNFTYYEIQGEKLIPHDFSNFNINVKGEKTPNLINGTFSPNTFDFTYQCRGTTTEKINVLVTDNKINKRLCITLDNNYVNYVPKP